MKCTGCSATIDAVAGRHSSIRFSDDDLFCPQNTTIQLIASNEMFSGGKSLLRLQPNLGHPRPHRNSTADGRWEFSKFQAVYAHRDLSRSGSQFPIRIL
jgi:hypothetical protein